MIQWKNYLAEYIGTALLCLVVTNTLVNPQLLPTPVMASLTLLLMVYTVGSISGCHLNPAVTIAATAFRKMPVIDGALYVLAQFAAAATITLVNQNLTGVSPSVMLESTGAAGMGEFVGTGILMFGIMSVILSRVPQAMSGVVIGGSLLLGIMVSGFLGSASILNPAVGLSLMTFSPLYVAGATLGALAGAGLSILIQKQDA